MSIVSERIRERISERDISEREVARLAGIPSSTLHRYAIGERPVPVDRLKVIADVLNTTPAYLMGLANAPKGFIPLPGMHQIPLVGSIACGTPILAEQNISDTVTTPDNMHADFALICKGDSMIGAGINDGDIVYIRKQDTAENGQIAAVRIGEEATLKRVQIVGSMMILQPENSSYAPIVLTDDNAEDVTIEGIAVGYTRYFKV